MRPNLIDEQNSALVAEAVIEAVEEAGFEPEEAIPGLVDAIILMAEKTSDPERFLDLAANRLADSGVE